MDSRQAPPDPVVATRQLTVALSTLADALAHVDVAAVLEAEPALTTALASMTAAGGWLAGRPADGQTRSALASELAGARAALARCAALGASLDSFVRGRGYAAVTYRRTADDPLGDLRTASGREA